MIFQEAGFKFSIDTLNRENGVAYSETTQCFDMQFLNNAKYDLTCNSA